MEIKLPHVPFKFETPDGPMEIAIRCGPTKSGGETIQQFCATASFIGHGPRALARIPLSVHADTYLEALSALTKGFKITPQSHDASSLEFRVLTALCSSGDVIEAD